MSNFTINIQISTDSAAELLADLQVIAGGLGYGAVLAEIRQVKELTMKNEDAFKELSDKFDAVGTVVADGLADIKSDIQKLIDAAGELSPESAAIVTSLEEKFTKLGDDVKAVSDAQ